MKTNTSYNKPYSQIKLEHILHRIQENGLTISQVKVLPEYKSLNQELNETLAAVIYYLVHEKSIHELINFIARSYSSKYYEDRKEYDTLDEIINETYVGLYNVITKSAGDTDNTGRVRIDTLNKEPEYFVCSLRTYIQNNIVKDIAKRHKVEMKHFEPDTAPVKDTDENESCNKLESVNYNKHNIENGIDFTEDLIRISSYNPNICLNLINNVIERFKSKKPVAGYIYLCMLNNSYDTMTVVSDLKSKDFNHVFHSILRELASNYNIDLSVYDDSVFEANKYIASLRSVDDKCARARIDRLAYQTRNDVKKLKAYIDAKSEYVDTIRF